MFFLKFNSIRVLIALAAGYCLICLAAMFLQRRLIYFPTRLSPGLADALATKEGFRPWLNGAGDVIGWNLPCQGTPTGIVLIAHGNAGWAVDRTYLAQPLHEAAALDVYLLEYPGYGARPGSPSQRTILAAGDEAFALLPKHLPIYLVSESLGGGVVAHLAKGNVRQVSGMLFFVPYDKLTSVGKRQMPFLPVSWLLWDRFDPEEWLKSYRGPVGFVLAGADEVIPTELGRHLSDGYDGPKRLQVVLEAGHNDVATQTPGWWREILQFWRANRTQD